MKYLTFTKQERNSYEICFLVPSLHMADIDRHYVEPFLDNEREHLLAYDLFQQGKKTPVKLQREYLEQLLPILEDLHVKYLVTCDAEYFKTLTKSPKADAALGYVLDSVCGRFKVIYCPNYKTIFYDPDRIKTNISAALRALAMHRQDTYLPPGYEIIKSGSYPSTTADIRSWLQLLLDMNCALSADIETFSLKHHEAGIGTISFAWNESEGVSFAVDYEPIPGATSAPYGRAVVNGPVRELLKEFFRAFKHKMIWHNISFDVYVLVYQLFMDDLLDTKGLLDGQAVLLNNWHCTKLITYLATNSCAGNKLGLKDQAQEFAGNYAVGDIKDITMIPLDVLLRYNLVDTLSTWFVFNKHWPTMVQDEQLEIYNELFQPCIWDIIQMQLTGLPIDMEEVKRLEIELQTHSDKAVAEMNNNILLQEFLYTENEALVLKKNAEYKVKRITLADVDVPFNPNSGPQLQRFLFEQLDLPVLDLTDTKQPATGGETLEKLLNHTEDPEILEFLQALLEFKGVDKLLTSFIPAFLKAAPDDNGWHWLFGNFNLGGTLSGRLSSSGPNLQNLPAKGKWAKLVKKCFKAPPGFLFIGLDFDSLEDKISALTTNDPNKLKVYTDGYDGHSLRAYSYFTERMSDIDPDSVASINSIGKKYPNERQDSKAPTFALTYQGTYITLINNSGFTEPLARHIENQYHELYRVSDEWVAARIHEASKTGFITGAFGLKVRTPLLKQTILGNRGTPYEAEAEGRSAGNALGQSWCLLNSRAHKEFMKVVRSGEYRLDIRPCAQIHDAGYYVIPDAMPVLRYVNKHLVEAVQWQDHPDIQHDAVKLSGQLGVFYPDWSAEMTLPIEASSETINDLAYKHHLKYCAETA